MIPLDRDNVPREGQRDDIGFQPIDHRTGLFAGTAVRLLDGDFLTRFLLPMFGKRRVELRVEFPRGIV